MDQPKKYKSSVDDFDRPPLKTRSETRKDQESKSDDWAEKRDFYSDEHKGKKKVNQRLKHKDKVDDPLTFASDKRLEDKTSSSNMFKGAEERTRSSKKAKTAKTDDLPFGSDKKRKKDSFARPKTKKTEEKPLSFASIRN